MNYPMIKHLILKDWYFQRWPIAALFGGGVLSLLLVGMGGQGGFYVGSILLMSVVIIVGAELAMVTVVNERKEQTLAFVMSLPISAMEYTTAKILANLLIFVVPFVTLMLGSFAVIANRPGLPDGLIPFAAIVLMQLFVNYSLLLAVALVSESQGWSIMALAAGNISINVFMYYVASMPGMAGAMKGDVVVWNEAAVMVLLGEVAAIGVLIGLTFFFQSRKTDFI
jgi:ABC-2 type transport system permease protein